jgi:hypothetical protein
MFRKILTKLDEQFAESTILEWREGYDTSEIVVII